MSEPLVSVVTPIGKQPRGLQETLDSVCAQTLADWEHLVVDDGGDDGARALVEARGAHDPRVRHIVRQGRCPGAGQTVGIKAARAPLVVLLGADETLTPGCLERRAAVLSRNTDLDFAIFRSGDRASATRAAAAGARSELSGDDLCRFLYADPPWSAAAPIWRRETLERLGLFDQAPRGWQDIELNVRAICAGCRYVRFTEIDHCVRRASVAGWAEEAPHGPEGALEALERVEAAVRAGPGMNWVRQRALCGLYFAVAETWVERGDLRSGLAAWDQVRSRRLGPAQLHGAGTALLRLRAVGAPVSGLIGGWKEWARLRALPEPAARRAAA